MKQYPVENLLREATETYTALTCGSLALLVLTKAELFLLTPFIAQMLCICLLLFGGFRGIQAYKILRYQKRLKLMPFYGLSTCQIPLSKDSLFLGRGFRWQSKHTQRLHQIKQVKNLDFIEAGKLYKKARSYVQGYSNTQLSKVLNSTSKLNPFKPLPDLGGASYLHGLGDKDKPIFINQSVRTGHTFVLGTTRVGKTRLASILINQDLRNGDAVIVVDPKGDLELVREMYSACLASGRLNDFKIVHLGYPELSATYNPIKNFSEITEIATRITESINAEGEGKQFADFAWKYVNIVVKTLNCLNKPMTYEEIAFYITRLDQLLMLYCDKILMPIDSNYNLKVNQILDEFNSRVDKHGHFLSPLPRSEAVLRYASEYIGEFFLTDNIQALQGDLLIELYDAAKIDKKYYDKITASIGPVLDKINSSNAAHIFSATHSTSEVELMDIIKNRKVLYIGLDSLSNFTVAQDVGKAFLADLVSTAGKIYKEPNANYKLNLHCDELSEIIQESFVKILNKAGGAGFQATVYAQTKQDLEVALGSRAMAEMAEGNFNTLIMLRVKNIDTAKILTDMLPKVDVVSHTQVSMVNDTPYGEDKVFFNTTNEDRVQMTSIPMLEPSDPNQLPKGQAFVLVNGGELYKIRIPLPIKDGLAPKDLRTIMKEINKITHTEDPLPKKTPMKETRHFSDSNTAKHSSDSDRAISLCSEGPDVNLKVLESFRFWLEKRIQSNNKNYLPKHQKLVKTTVSYNKNIVFVERELLSKYQTRSGVEIKTLEEMLTLSFDKRKFFLKTNQSPQVFPVKLALSIDIETSSEIEEGQ